MSVELSNFFENLLYKGLEHFGKYYGTYRALVASNEDPEKRGRVQLYCPELGQTEAPNIWIDPSIDYAGIDGTHGSFWPPEVGDTVRVSFSHGNPSTPTLYHGGWYPEKQVPKKLGHDEGGDSEKGTPPIKRGFVTKSGHSLVFNDKKDKESVELTWKDDSAKITIDEKGAVTILTGKSHVLIDRESKKIEILDENKNTITLDDNGVTVKTSKKVMVEGSQGATIKASKIDLASSNVNLTDSADEPAVKGQTLFDWLKSHQHGTGVGPSTPPTMPPLPSMLSKKAKVG